MIDSQLSAVRTLIENDCIVICAGGGGIPVVEDSEKKGCYRGIEAVIDKDRAAAMVGAELGASALLILTDVSAVCVDFGKPSERRIKRASPGILKKLMIEGHFPDGSMGPKIESAIDFVRGRGGDNRHQIKRWAAIGSLEQADKIVEGKAGTIIKMISESDDEQLFELYEDWQFD
jgi:carbamate kinase